MFRKLLFLFSVTALAVALAGCGGSSASEETLRVGLIPNQNPEEVEAQYQPLEDYLREEIGREVEVSVPATYNAVVEALVSGELDMAYFGGLTYVQARQRADVTPLVTEVNPRTGTTKYRSLIITSTESDIFEVEQVEGRNFAFGSVSSTSGSLYPSIMLKKAGIDYRTDLGEYTYTGGHDTTAQAVANGRVDAGGLEDRIFYDLRDEGVIEEGSIRIVAESEPIEGYPWVVRDDLPDEDQEALANAYLDMENPELLDLMRAESYARVSADDYDYVEKQARALNLLVEPEE
ncbi:MAG: phosphate/phosphite/phosphonate ABC transporter substrate-binding protein [Actinomycetota bacterium]|nr:phosphate/phosphite/phosphonate ABC transporter substrate-binding protein [Actinomycetota bacterium]